MTISYLSIIGGYMSKNRNYTLEALRIACMCLITIIHFFSYSDILNSNLNNSFRVGFSILFSLSRCSVNIFFIISGFFLCKKDFSFNRIIKVYSQMLFASILSFVICVLLNIKEVDYLDILKTIMPLLTNHYWFISVYIIVVIFSPAINLLIEKEKYVRIRKGILVGGGILTLYITLNPFIIGNTMIGGDHSLLWALFCYFIGGCISKYGINIKKEKLVAVFLSALFALAIIKFYKVDIILSMYSFDFESNSSILPFLMSVSLFGLLIQRKERVGEQSSILKKIIFILAQVSLFVYLIQENELFREYVWKDLRGTLNPQLAIYELCKIIILLYLGAILYGILYNVLKKFILYMLKGLKKYGKD